MGASLPEPVYRDMVAALFAMDVPVAGMGVLFATAGTLMALEHGGWLLAALTAAGIAATCARLALFQAFRGRTAGEVTALSELERWEARYAWGSYASAALLGALSVAALSSHAPLNHMVVVSLVFTFGAGTVARISCRPLICVPSVLLAAAPAIVALAVHAGGQIGQEWHAEYFFVEAVLVSVVTALSIETVRHLYRSTVEQLTTRHDLTHLVRKDALTGLPNRLLLRERFAGSLETSLAEKASVALHFLDLDGFKSVNDRYGHPVGDLLLREVAVRLSGSVRSKDTVARLGGDEFVVVQEGIHHVDEATMLARRVIKQLSAPYAVNGHLLEISVSVGIAIATRDERDFDELSVRADAALYDSKRAGKGRFHLCAPSDPSAPGPAVSAGGMG
ncbi:GGDEF domain-containing protein [Sphingobium sp. CFD-2]|uniref:GGDEF domain-containing protein n=1 Tax=Sphingobium sp. CFD-2 TaxID=2878542 RepID=UPI00214C30C0|nr:GGDEF domain-containing protein [Sphingobium sp. CFD-2]